MIFFPSWIAFDLYAYPSQIPMAASLEVSISEFIQTNVGSPQSYEPDDSSFVGVWPYDEGVISVTFSYVETEPWYDRVPWPTRTTDPRTTVAYEGQTYQLPDNAAQTLLGFGNVGLVNDSPAAQAR